MKFIKTIIQEFYNTKFTQIINNKKLCINYMQSFIKDDKKILGRWNIEHCNNKIDNKIDLSNEDHCGPCGQYLLNKTKKK
jgi:hypothetical protein